MNPLTVTHQTLSLPSMGCGTWAWGNRLLWGYDESMDSQLQAVFNLCVERGVTLFDTGDSYGTGKLNGQSEKLLGRFTGEYSGYNADIRGREGRHRPPLPFRTVHETFTSHGS